MGELQKIGQFRDPRNVVLFLKVMASIPLFRFLLFWVKIPTLLKSLDRSSGKRTCFGEDDLKRARLAWKYANFFLLRCLRVKNPCLLRSLVLFRLFRKSGLDVQIHFGVKKNVSLLEGHSWLLLNRNLLLEPTDPQLIYTQVYSFPDETSRIQTTRPND